MILLNIWLNMMLGPLRITTVMQFTDIAALAPSLERPSKYTYKWMASYGPSNFITLASSTCKVAMVRLHSLQHSPSIAKSLYAMLSKFVREVDKRDIKVGGDMAEVVECSLDERHAAPRRCGGGGTNAAAATAAVESGEREMLLAEGF